MTDTIHLYPGYTLRLVDLMSPVEIDKAMTLGDLCRILRSSEEVDLGTLSALIQCPLAPFLDECLLSEEEEPDMGLHTIRLTWTCEYELPGGTDEGDVPSPTSLRLDVDAVGETWEDHRPGGHLYEEGKDLSKCNGYAIELTPLYKLRHLLLRIDPVMYVRPFLSRDDSGEMEIRAPETTLLLLINALFWELSFFGTPERRDAELRELRGRVERIEAGDAKVIPLEEIFERGL